MHKACYVQVAPVAELVAVRANLRRLYKSTATDATLSEEGTEVQNRAELALTSNSSRATGSTKRRPPSLLRALFYTFCFLATGAVASSLPNREAGICPARACVYPC